MERLRFYIAHSWNDLKVGGRRTLFALFCIAAGVAAVVSLQTLGTMIEASLTGNLQELNRGDIRILPPGLGPARTAARSDVEFDERYLEAIPGNAALFTMEGIQAIEQAVHRYDPRAEVSYRYQSPQNPLIGTFIETENGSETILPLFIEIDFSIYGEVEMLDGLLVGEVIRNPTDIVISDNAAADHGLAIGDQIKLNGSDTLFTIRGIVSREVEMVTENGAAVMLVGFYYMDVSAVNFFDDVAPSERYAAEIYIKLSQDDPELVTRVDERLTDQFSFISAITTADLREQNSQITDAINDLVLLMGLISLLIGGIGIINTMLVIVMRRTTEIAVLKTIGLKARQVTMLFLVEAIVLGIVGSLIGCVLGVAFAAILENFEVWFGTRLEWVFSAEAVVRGFVLGVIVTAVFGFLPTLIAGQVRPGNVLRPSTTQLPQIGVLQTLAAMLVIFVVMGIVVWSILGSGLSPDADDVTSIFSVAFPVALASGIAGAAIAPGLPAFNRPVASLGTWSRFFRWSLLSFGALVQTVFQGMLFFSIVIVIVAIVEGKLTTISVAIATIFGIFMGLIVSARAFKTQRSIFITLGSVLVGFILLTVLGFVVGMLAGGLIYVVANAMGIWSVLVDVFMAIGLVESAFVIAMAAVGVLWFLVTFAAGTPSMGVPDIKISLRALVVNRNRVATTLLALVIGVLTLSLVTMFATSLKRFFELNLEDNLGGNVLLITLSGGSNWEDTLYGLEDILTTSEDVNSYTLLTNYQVDFVALEKADGQRLKRTQLIDIVRAEVGDHEDLSDFLDISLGSIDGRFVDSTLPEKKFTEGGRQLRDGDAGQQVIVVVGTRAIRATGMEPGDALIFNFFGATGDQPRQMRFEIVGVTDESLGDLSSNFGSFIYAPIDSFEGSTPFMIGSVVDVREEHIPQFREKLQAEVNGVVMLETRQLNQLVSRLIDQFTALPVVVAVLNLITGGAVIANSVALSTMERRREIGVMKSLGVQRERVLGMLLLENSLMGFLAGIIGVGGSLLLLIWLWALLFDGDLRGALPVGTALMLMALCVCISITAAILTAWGASGEKPLNVLRNE